VPCGWGGWVGGVLQQLLMQGHHACCMQAW